MQLDPKSKKFDKLLEEFVGAVKHHIQEEESDILPALEKAVSKKRLNELGLAFSERRAEELDKLAKTEGMTSAKSKGKPTSNATSKAPASKTARKTATKAAGKTKAKAASKPSAKARPAAGATKDELYQTARKLDIPGRSKMTKKELEKAVSKAGKR